MCRVVNKCTFVITMVRYCAAKGCNVKEKQGIMLFRFPKEPERRAKWITIVNRVNWQPYSNSTLCELHFGEDQWEQTRVDGSRKLRYSAIPSLLLSKENSSPVPSVSFIDKHNYCSLSSASATIFRQSQSPLKDITNVIQSSASLSDLKTMEKEFVEESVEKSVKESVIEPVEESVKEIVDLKQQLELKEKELAALQTKHISMQKIADRVFKIYHNIKRQNETMKTKLKRLQCSYCRSSKLFAPKLHEDQLKALCSNTTRGRKWSIQSITDGLIYKMKWGTQGYSDFVKKYPIFPSVRTLQEAVEHMKFESGILEEVFDVIQCQIPHMTLHEIHCVVVLDEMAIKPGEMYDSSTKRIIGLCTFPGHIGLAKKALVIALAGITTRWKYAVAYYLTNKVDSEAKQTNCNFTGNALKDIISKVIVKAENIGLKVAAVISDMGSDNLSLWRACNIGYQNDEVRCTIPHPARLQDKLCIMPDPVHLFKNIRSMLERQKVIYLPESILHSLGLSYPIVEVKYLEELMRHEQKFEFKISKFTESSLQTKNNHFSTMKVSTPSLCIPIYEDWHKRSLETGPDRTTHGRFTQDCLENLFSLLRFRQPVPYALHFKQNLKMITLSQLSNNTKKNTSYYNDDDTKKIEHNFLEFSKAIGISRQHEKDLNAFFETCAIKIPQVSDNQMHSIDEWEWPIIYDIAGSVVRSVKCINIKICDDCFKSVLWNGKKYHPYSIIVQMRSYTENSLLHVSDPCFKAIMKSEITFRHLKDTLTKAKDMNIVNFVVKELEYVWEGANIPLCHDITTKILKRFITMRLKMYGLKERKKHAEMNFERVYNSKTAARFAIIS
ncbi:uncharacterized protein LOC118647293 isoform X3 [Monomorium pharaonis]|uniref:uncharacterized protein LOC118646040 isoform X3 n=1 Tax=Monomorium pharaonis TaxID=307658 RepID=UPI001746C434|nr:uncharacterized protein LOC118646040 isoform X3 [Monomorium pharaonis]XP_036147615.1 uncharacterized protein LOC118647242 isoform X3 [Monomorium pharaonis]XP_036147946.1 uncharacterized protein LOC118647293 isoform X3 [Monomorium pharaonis]